MFYKKCALKNLANFVRQFQKKKIPIKKFVRQDQRLSMQHYQKRSSSTIFFPVNFAKFLRETYRIFFD